MTAGPLEIGGDGGPRPIVSGRTARRVATFLVLASALVCALFVWPGFLRGGTAYVIVSGNSMEPTLHGGDVVFPVRRRSYEVGDIIAYRIPSGKPGAGVLIIHRIVGGSARAGYLVQGDNRGGRDAWRPRPADIAGAARVTVPRVGLALIWLRTPIGLATLAAILTALILLREPPADGRRKAVRATDRPPASDPTAAVRRGPSFPKELGSAAGRAAVRGFKSRSRAPQRVEPARGALTMKAFGVAAKQLAGRAPAPLTDRQRHGNAFPLALSRSWGEATWTAADLWTRPSVRRAQDGQPEAAGSAVSLDYRARKRKALSVVATLLAAPPR